MRKKFSYEKMEDQKELATFGFWKEETYCDLLSCQEGNMTEDEFKSKYLTPNDFKILKRRLPPWKFGQL